MNAPHPPVPGREMLLVFLGLVKPTAHDGYAQAEERKHHAEIVPLRPKPSSRDHLEEIGR